MRIRDCCILADTNSTDEKVRPDWAKGDIANYKRSAACLYDWLSGP